MIDLYNSAEGEDKGDNKEDLLNEFLGNLVPQNDFYDQSAGENTSLALHETPKEEYNEVAIPTHIEEKITSLQKITTSIEKQLVTQPAQIEQKRNFKINYAQVLNEAQLAAVAITEQPVLVIAGAGSGKTRVIVHRMAYLIERGVPPEAILLLTFTRKAAKEMLDRAETILQDKNVNKVTGGTFHSFASYILRRFANVIGLPPNFTIIDSSDAEDVIDLIRTELKFNKSDKKFPRKGRIHEIISYARNCDKSIAEIIRSQFTGLEDYIKHIELIAMGYQKYKKLSRLLDFDDLMEVLRDALRTHVSFREKLQNTYQYIMVDEFQDTNVVQKEIVDLIAGRHKRLMVVGDDAQSIYAFRGANYENILRFPQTYANCAIVKIERNYRSNANILDFTNAIIDSAALGYKKRLHTDVQNQHKPFIKRVFGQDDEAIFIVDRILQLLEKGVPLNQIAILNRADWHNRYIQAELNKRGIPYVVIGGFKFNERMHIKDIIAYLRLTFNPTDAVSWHRVLKYIGGIGHVTATKLVAGLQQSENPFSFEAFQKKQFFEELLKLGNMLNAASQPELALTKKIELIKEYYYPLLKARENDYLQRMQDVDVLIDLSKKYKDLDRFLSDFALDPPSKRVADQSRPLINEGEEKGKLTISTVHSAKGLEWYAVFIPHALEGLFPSNRAKDIEEMEEERRLFYVACSRAKEELFVTFPRNVYSFDA